MKIKLKYTFIFASVTLALFLIDWLLKHFLFDWDKYNVENWSASWNWKIIAGRSLLHKSTTIFDFLKISMPFWANQLLSWIIFSGISFLGIFSVNKVFAVGVGIVLAGILGNTLDNVFTGGVRDIFFIPWSDRGTFNLADVLVVGGAMLTLIGVLLNIFKEGKEQKISKDMEAENVKSN